MIGIGITHYGTDTLRDKAIEQIFKFAPKDCKIHIAKNIEGISKAKNACLKELDNCEHIFLFDSDTYPKMLSWERIYAESSHKHMSYTFGRKVLTVEGGIISYEKPSGCMLYIHRDCLDKIGGFDEQYKGYAGEHQDFSNRVYNAGLTKYRYMDLVFSNQFIHSMDEHKEIKSSVPAGIRSANIPPNMRRLKEQWDSQEFKPYK